MKITGLNGKGHRWNLIGHVPLLNDERHRSSYHLQARQVLNELFPLERILEEVPLPGSDGLTADFFIPTQMLMIEVHGEQHYQEIGFFHKSTLDFHAGQTRDKKKRRWCELNDITLVELPYDRRDEWRRRITESQDGQDSGGSR